MRRIVNCILGICICMLLTLPVYALTYVDDMADSSQNNIKSYSNLVSPASGSAWSNLPDPSVFTFASSQSLLGRADYRVQNGRQITVGLYTLVGSYASQMPDGTYALGIYDDSGSVQGGTMVQASYSPSAKAIYTKVDGVLCRAHYDGTIYPFVPVTESDKPGDLVGYGVNVYVSTGGQSYSRITLTPTQLIFKPRSTFVYEELSGTIPAGTTHVRVELNDAAQFPLADRPGTFAQKAGKNFNSLASVAISGDDLVVGVPEPLQSESTVQPASPSSSQSSAKSRSESYGYAGGAGTAGGTVSSSKAAVSKFEGVIESSAGSGRRTASEKPVSSAKERSSSAISAQEESASAYNRMDENQVYQITGKSGDENSHFTAGIVLYIIIVFGALLFVLLGAKNKKG